MKNRTETLAEGMKVLREKRPLIHCITSPVAINDCANAVLATGARIICAEHPDEVSDITAMSSALGVSLANITDARAQSVLISGQTAWKKKIPSVIDAVGITCSDLRRSIFRQYVHTCHPAVIKGNASEILEGFQLEENRNPDGKTGVDVASSDQVRHDSPASQKRMGEITRKYAELTGSVICASGEVDVISNADTTVYLENGNASMADVTGTGCMLNCLIAAYLSVLDPLDAAVVGTALMGIAGEYAGQECMKKSGGNRIGLGSFHISLLDGLSLITPDDLVQRIRIHEVSL